MDGAPTPGGCVTGCVRFFTAILQNYRWVLIRWEYHLENFLGFVQLACVLILLRHL